MSANYSRLLAHFAQPLAAVCYSPAHLMPLQYRSPPTPASPSATEQPPVIPPDDSTPCNGGFAYIKMMSSLSFTKSPAAIAGPWPSCNPNSWCACWNPAFLASGSKSFNLLPAPAHGAKSIRLIPSAMKWLFPCTLADQTTFAALPTSLYWQVRFLYLRLCWRAGFIVIT